MPQLIDLPEPLPSRLRFLEPGATIAQRIRAAAANHTTWFLAGTHVRGGEVRRENGVTWTYTPDGGDIAFPRLPAKTAGETLDRIMAYYWERKPARVGCWALTPTRPRDLGTRLAARGFEWGWQPHWMALDLHAIRVDFPIPDGLHLAIDDEGDWEVNDLPYHDRGSVAKIQALARARPRRTWHFGAWLDGKIVGHSLIHVTTGRLGIAGIYNVGVVPAARNQGIGTAITLAACQVAQALGCHHALLNSAADHLYERIGFESLGRGQSWWLHAPTLATPPPTPAQIAFVEAVGRGDLRALNAFPPQTLPADMDAPTLCGMTPMALAAHARKPASIEWLVAQGATLDILHAWDMGWKARAAQLLVENPGLANRRSGNWQLTPLHEAASRGDAELARLLLTAHPDLAIQDTQFNGTPLGWARHFQRTEIIALIEQYQAARTM